MHDHLFMQVARSSITSHANRSAYHDRGARARTTLTYSLSRCHPTIVAGELGKHATTKKKINSGDDSAGGTNAIIHPGIKNEGTIVLYTYQQKIASQSANDWHRISWIILSNHVM